MAVLTGNETATDYINLGKDIFQYFGLGCRNVSKLYVPKDYSFNLFFESILNDYQDVVNNNKYANNYDYNKAVYLLGNNQLLDNNFVMLKEDKSLSSPVAVIHYEYYIPIYIGMILFGVRELTSSNSYTNNTNIVNLI